jgi:tetratricopeptide (TPR) repeat protein
MIFLRGWLVLAILAVAVPRASAAAREEKWLRVATAEFTLFTTLSEKEGVIWAEEFAQFIAELRTLFGFKRPLTPLTIVIFAQTRAFNDYRPLNEKGAPASVAGFFLRHESWAVAGLAGASASDEVRRTIFHEGVHWFLSAVGYTNPVWVEEGLAELYSTFAVKKGKAEWGQAIPDHVSLLHVSALMPMERLVYLTRGELFVDESARTGIAYAQSWAAVHLLVHGENAKIRRNGLFEFMQLTHDGKPVGEAFRQAVGMDYAAFNRLLQNYLQGGTYYKISRPLQPLPKLTAAPAVPFEVKQALGRLALAAQRREKAMAFARESIGLLPDDPRGYELLGMARQENGDVAGGVEAYTVAVEKGSNDFQPYFELAFRAQQAAADADGQITSLSPADARRIADNYERAIVLHPRLLAAYQNLAGVVGLAETRPHDREYFALGRKIFPKDGMIRVGEAVLTERAGDRAAAIKTVDELSDERDQPNRVRTYARNLYQAWTQQEIGQRIDALNKEKKYSEALAYLDQQYALTTSAALRTQLSGMRSQIQAALRSDEIADAFREERWDEARRLLSETAESSTFPPFLRQQAKRALEDMERRGVGRKTAPRSR